MAELGDRWRDLGEFIREQRSNNRLSLRSLSQLAGISNPYLSQIERGLRKPSAEILQQIAKALRIQAETLYVRAGILEERSTEHDLEGEILRDPFLTEDQNRTTGWRRRPTRSTSRPSAHGRWCPWQDSSVDFRQSTDWAHRLHGHGSRPQCSVVGGRPRLQSGGATRGDSTTSRYAFLIAQCFTDAAAMTRDAFRR
jgi:transcriptional regulator with XRE-family HTH domain